MKGKWKPLNGLCRDYYRAKSTLSRGFYVLKRYLDRPLSLWGLDEKAQTFPSYRIEVICAFLLDGFVFFFLSVHVASRVAPVHIVRNVKA